MRTALIAAVLLLATSRIAAANEPLAACREPSSDTADAAPAPADKKPDPFSFADFTWLNGNSRQKKSPLDSNVFTGEFRLDANYVYDFNHPQDHTLDGSSETGRTNELQVQQLGIGGDDDNVRGRLMTQFGLYSQTRINLAMLVKF